MTILDPIGDLLTRIRNGLMVRHAFVSSPHSNVRARILDVLKDEGYITGYSVESEGAFKVLKVELKYDRDGAVIKTLKRVSTPSRRVYSSFKDLKPVHNGLGINILSTPKGIMSGQKARECRVGGEVICSVF